MSYLNKFLLKNKICLVTGGAGGIGLNMIQASLLRNANPIIAVDLTEDKLSMAKEMGATHIINSKIKDG